jgi:anti-sigma factor ChrR (cupin superfamily)
MNEGLIFQNVLVGSELGKLEWRPYSKDGRLGVDCVPLYDGRDPDGRGPAAALLRYAPGAKVSRHLHPCYELILVLDGILTDDTGDHPAGSLEICPPGSTHELSSRAGCTLLVVWEQPVQLEKPIGSEARSTTSRAEYGDTRR